MAASSSYPTRSSDRARNAATQISTTLRTSPTLAEQNLNEADIVFPEIVKSSSACVAADTALVDALRDNSLGTKDIEDFYTAAKQAYSNVKSLSASK
jgi:hypothetical protein